MTYAKKIFTQDELNDIAYREFMKEVKYVVSTFEHVVDAKTNMMQLAEISGIDTSGLSGTGKTLALTYLYLNVFNVWLKDETEDLSATMKKLDSELAKAENWALELKNFNFNSMFKSKPVTEPKAEHKPENS